MWEVLKKQSLTHQVNKFRVLFSTFLPRNFLADLPFVPHHAPANSFQHLENRFIKAMEQIAMLSLDKEQLEHLVARLQDETGC